jgi:hypothetical protein
MKPEIRPETKMVRNCRNKSSKVHIASNIIRASSVLFVSFGNAGAIWRITPEPVIGPRFARDRLG